MARSIRRWGVVGVLLVGVVLGAATPGLAAKGRPAAGPGTVAWITINAADGDLLGAEDPDREGAPASMTKMMLALLVVEAVRDGQLKLSDPVTTSAVASKMGGSQVYLKQGESFSVDDLLGALMVGSANDAAAALAERLAGSLQGAVDRMNERAAALKLTKTRFGSVHGLPPSPGQPGDLTTPRDMARLSQELVKFPDVLRWTSTPDAPFRGGAFHMQNVNKLVGRVAGVDGLKTGHFHEAGYNLAATAKRGDVRIISVIMGAPSNAARFSEAARRLEEGFARYVKVTVAKAGAPVGDPVWIGRARTDFRPVPGGEVAVLVKREEREALKSSVELQPDLRAPLPQGHRVGTLVVRAGEKEVARVPVVTPAPIARKTFWWLTPWK
ncbi:MAG: D-alanyl-D-alanine carboxypeptidase family protein [Candidatus Methylomirabilales bacterium]